VDKFSQIIMYNKKDILTYVLILTGIMFFHVYSIISSYKNEEFSDIDFVYLSLPLLCAVFSFWVAKHANFSDVFGKAYVSLSIAFIFLFCAEFTYVIVYEIILQQDPYPSFADIFYLLFYPFAIYHITKTINHFLDIQVRHYIIIAGIVSLITITYFGLSFDGVVDDVFLLGIVSVFASSLVFSLSIVAFLAFQKGEMGKVWFILSLGIFLHIFANVWYYYLEMFEAYSGTHIVNTLWVASWIVICYALILHKKMISYKKNNT